MTWADQRNRQKSQARRIVESCEPRGPVGSLLSTDENPPVYVGTVVALIDESGRTVTATKAGHEGYEFGGMDTFPGGRVRRSRTQTLPGAIAKTAVERTLRETGIVVDPSDLTIRLDLCAPTRYTDIGGNDTYCVIVPVTRLGDIPEPSTRISASSIAAATVAPLASSVARMAHANMLIAGDLLLPASADLAQSDLAQILEEAFDLVVSACDPFMSQVS